MRSRRALEATSRRLLRRLELAAIGVRRPRGCAKPLHAASSPRASGRGDLHMATTTRAALTTLGPGRRPRRAPTPRRAVSVARARAAVPRVPIPTLPRSPSRRPRRPRRLVRRFCPSPSLTSAPTRAPSPPAPLNSRPRRPHPPSRGRRALLRRRRLSPSLRRARRPLRPRPGLAGLDRGPRAWLPSTPSDSTARWLTTPPSSTPSTSLATRRRSVQSRSRAQRRGSLRVAARARGLRRDASPRRRGASKIRTSSTPGKRAGVDGRLGRRAEGGAESARLFQSSKGFKSSASTTQRLGGRCTPPRTRRWRWRNWGMRRVPSPRRRRWPDSAQLRGHARGVSGVVLLEGAGGGRGGGVGARVRRNAGMRKVQRSGLRAEDSKMATGDGG